jgi:4-hydroxy-tetrahydrodipicolinate synthase
MVNLNDPVQLLVNCAQCHPFGVQLITVECHLYFFWPSKEMIQGSIVAIVTPMREDGSLDLAAFRAVIDFHIEQGSDGIVVAGTTGESPTVNVEEHELLIAEAVKHAARRIPIIAGTGANSTTEAIELAAFSKKAGADASLSVVPYYNKPTQEGLYLHFKTIAEKVDMPHILYNVPGRTVADMSNDTALRLAQISNIVGIKDATGDIERGSDLLQHAPKGFAIYSGDDASTLALMLLGAHGAISVTANVAPRLMHEMCAAALNGEVVKAREINFRLLGLHRDLFVEANPIPVKWAVARMGKMKNSLRLPLTPLSPSAHAVVEAAMRHAGVL